MSGVHGHKLHCGWKHAASQVLKLVGVERSRGHAVLRFMAGGRALRALGRALAREQGMTKVRAPAQVTSPCPASSAMSWTNTLHAITQFECSSAPGSRWFSVLS